MFIAEDTLDYHQFGQLTHYEVEKILNEFLEDAYYSDKSQVLIITGKGKLIRPIMPKLLKKHKLVKNFKTAGYYNGQDGAFEVTLVN